jgi:hypothetical protein
MDFEKLGSFYLGKEFDVSSGRLLDRLLMYDARELTTHAVCVGMTGSGKTGLCIDLLEEAAIDRVPALVIDPKGDITNLLLQFPRLQPDDFLPWVDPDEARRKGLPVEEFARAQADLWRTGLARWGQDGSRIQMLQESAEYRIYTPGSQAGLPVSVLHSFGAPEPGWEADAESVRERIEGTVSALLGLVGVTADPVRSREHILLANLIEHFWRKGEDLDLRKLILAIQKPPIVHLGVFDLETFFPAKDRFDLMMRLNNIIASPSFAAWLEGEPLDIADMLVSPEGKPRHSIFSIAHLNEPERLFFVTMLLNQVVSWMRGQPGTTSLRAIVYMDEIFGFFPPVANPPSKKPMLTLLKQARAFGVGMLLATQNPVDLDYKGLTNAGTWFIGRLQTERDKERVVEGLLGAAGGSGLGRQDLARLISTLGNRVFLLHSVHGEGPVTFQTRWAMSYLRGPLTREQISRLMAAKKEAPAPTARAVGEAKAVPSTVERDLDTPPALGPGLSQEFLPRKISAAEAELRRTGLSSEQARASLVYMPRMLARGTVHFVHRQTQTDSREEFALLAELPASPGGVAWDRARPLPVPPSASSRRGEEGARYQPLPGGLNLAQDVRRATQDLAEYLYRTRRLTLFHSPALKAHSTPGEERGDFVLRLNQQAREARDAEVDRLSEQFRRRLDRLRDRLRQAELALAKSEATESARKRELVVSVGESVLGMFLGRRSMRTASSSLGKYRMKSTAGVAREQAAERVETARREIEELERELKSKADEISRRWDEGGRNLEEVAVAPRRTDIRIESVGLAWEPCWVLVGIEAGEGLPGEIVSAV